MSIVQFSFSGESQGISRFVGKARDFQITIDQPPVSESVESNNPCPVEYTLAALGGCVNIVAHHIAQELDINLKSLKIKVDGNLNPNRFVNGDSSERAGFTDITVHLDVESDASPELLDKWLTIVKDRCPVSDNLANQTKLAIAV